MPPKGTLQGLFPSLPQSGNWAEDERQKTAKVLEGVFTDSVGAPSLSSEKVYEVKVCQ